MNPRLAAIVMTGSRRSLLNDISPGLPSGSIRRGGEGGRTGRLTRNPTASIRRNRSEAVGFLADEGAAPCVGDDDVDRGAVHRFQARPARPPCAEDDVPGSTQPAAVLPCPIGRHRPVDREIDVADPLFAEYQIALFRAHGHLPSDGHGPSGEY